MGRLFTIASTCTLFVASAMWAAPPKQPGKGSVPADHKPRPVALRTYENAEYKFRFQAPDSWQPAEVGDGRTLHNLMIPADYASLPAPKGGGPRTVYGDVFLVVVSPISAANADLDSTVTEIRARIAEHNPAAEFRPVEKAKIAGVDASILTASMASKREDEAKLVRRYLVFLRDGKVFQIVLYAHANTIAKQTTAVQKIVKSFEWTDQPSAALDRKGAAGATAKTFTNAEHGLQLQMPAGWDDGQSSIPGSIAVFFPPGDADGHVNLFTRDPQGKDTDGVLTVLQSEIRTHDANAKIDPTEDAKLGGEPARMFTYHVKLADGERSSLMLAGIHSGKAYILAYSAAPAEYEKNVAAVKQMIESFRWTKATTGDGSARATTKPAA